MGDTPQAVESILAAIHALTPAQRRLLWRQLRVEGLSPDEPITDRNARQIAPALARRQAGGRGEAASPVRGPQPVSPTAGAPLQAPSSAQSQSYRAPVSGKVVLAGADAAESSLHIMSPLPGQAPEAPIVIVFDGGSKGNPGRGYGSYALDWPGAPQQIVQLQFGDRVTNNEAEYDTLIAALESLLKRLQDRGADTRTARVEIRGDSLLVINQVQGSWQCKEPRLQMRRDQVRQLLQRFGSWRLTHHDREQSVRVLGH